MPQALKVTEENLDYIVEYATRLNFNVSYIHDALEDANKNSREVYVVTDGCEKYNNIIFTTFWSEDFDRLWKFKSEENPSSFAEIERIK